MSVSAVAQSCGKRFWLAVPYNCGVEEAWAFKPTRTYLFTSPCRSDKGGVDIFRPCFQRLCGSGKGKLVYSRHLGEVLSLLVLRRQFSRWGFPGDSGVRGPVRFGPPHTIWNFLKLSIRAIWYDKNSVSCNTPHLDMEPSAYAVAHSRRQRRPVLNFLSPWRQTSVWLSCVLC